jgi:predicted phage tail protein
MPITQEAQAKTRAFARVLGPFLVIVPGIIVAKLSEVALLAAPFFANPALVFIMGALMVFGGICVIANHQIWRGASAILISLFGWFLGLRGLALLLAPRAYEHLTEASQGVAAGSSPFWPNFPRRLKLTYDGWIAKPPPGQ